MILERVGPSSFYGREEGLRAVWPKVVAAQAAAYWISVTDAAIVLSVGLTTDGSARALWVEGLGGQVAGGVKARLRLMRDVLAECEQIGRADGCSEIRIEMGQRPGWKRTLLPGLGFELHRIGDVAVMRKAL